MSQKKCPKCGEGNPVEAVMCWACYTPLSGASSNAAGAAATPPINAAPSGEKTKKEIPKWQMGVIGVAVLGGVGFAVMTLMGGGSAAGTEVAEVAADAAKAVTAVTKKTTVTTTTTILPPNAPVVAAPAIAPAPAVTATGQMRFTLSTPPRRGIPWGTMAIVPTDSAASQDAAGLAATASRNMAKTGRWEGLYVFVFQDNATAQKFRRYQRERGGQPLEDSDYSALQEIWSNTLLRYDYTRNGYESMRYPAKNPSGWWNGKPKFNRSRT